MRDWPIPLKISAEAMPLAEAMYRAQCKVYGPAQPVPFTDFPDRDAYRECAIAVLQALEPKRERKSESALEMAAESARKAFKLIRSR